MAGPPAATVPAVSRAETFEARPASMATPVPEPVGPARTAPAAAFASADSSVHRHLGGFFRPEIGFGYLITSASQGGTDVSMGGLAGTFGFALGTSVGENSILALRLSDTVVGNPDVTVNGTSNSSSDTTFSLIAVGAEYTYYTGGNYYFAISPSLTRATLVTSSSSGDTDVGFGLRLGIGKEWWVGDHWGLGLVGQLSMSSNADSGNSGATWSTWATTVSFSATYN